jgi:flagellar protein FliO/FliZ
MEAPHPIPFLIRPVARATAAILPRTALVLALAAGPAVAVAADVAGPPYATGDGIPVVRILCALALVLGAMFATKMLRRGVHIRGDASVPVLQVLAQTPVGSRERAVLLRVGDQQVLVGVAAGNVRLLLELPPAPPAAPSDNAPPAPTGEGPSTPSFRDVLMRSLGR